MDTTFEETIEAAISLEQEAIDFYTMLKDKVTRPEIKDVLDEMVTQERGHKAKLENILKKKTFPKGGRIHPDSDLKLADYVVSVDEDNENLSYQDALIIGMKREKASIEFYTKLSQEVDHPELKELFTFLAEEESKHKNLFETRFEDQMG